MTKEKRKHRAEWGNGTCGKQKGDSKYQNGHLSVFDMWKKWLLRNRKEKKIRKLGKNQTLT